MDELWRAVLWGCSVPPDALAGAVEAAVADRGFQVLVNTDVPFVTLHVSARTMREQREHSNDAMRLARVLLSLYTATGASHCAFPASDALMAGGWHKFDPTALAIEFAIVPVDAVPAMLPPGVRMIRLTPAGVIVTSLPVKSSPGEHIDPVDIDAAKARWDVNALVQRCQAAGEAAYDRMYDARDRSALRWEHELAEDAFLEAIKAATTIGALSEAAAIRDRLAHVRAVYRQLQS